MSIENGTIQQQSSALNPGESVRGIIGRGLDYARQGRHAEAMAQLYRASEQVSPEHSLTNVLDSCIQSQRQYEQAQRSLHQASLHFAAAQAAQQTQLANLHYLVSGANVREPLFDAAPRLSRVRIDRLPPPAAGDESALPALEFTCFGQFTVRRAGQAVELCANRSGQAILRYLVAHEQHRATMDELMEALWPEDDPDLARHKLRVAASALRMALNAGYDCPKGGGYLLCESGAYALNPAVTLRIDVVAFLAGYAAGQQAGAHEAARDYEAACRLYTGPFLREDLYADWPIIRREQLTQIYLTMCGALAEHNLATGRPDAAVRWATSILEENRCDEPAYQQLMRAYAALGRRGEVLRQYQRCQEALAQELDVEPMPETMELVHTLLRGEPVSRAAHSNDRKRAIAASDS